MALPLFDDQEEKTIEAMLEPENTSLGKRMFPSRTRSLIAQDIENFKPTIGILHIGNQPRRNRATTFTGCLPVHDPSVRPKRRTTSQQESIVHNPKLFSRSHSERNTSLVNPNFEPSLRARTLSERISSSSSETSSKVLFKY